MMKNRKILSWQELGKKINKCLFRVNYICLFVCLGAFNVGAKVYAQQEKLVLASRQLTVEEVLDAISAQSKYYVFYSENELNIKQKVTFKDKVVSLEEVLKTILENRFTYSFEGETIVITPVRPEEQSPELIKLTGRVMDKGKVPLPGVTVRIKGTSLGVSTDQEGKYRLEFPQTKQVVLVYSFVGMETQEVTYKGEENIDVTLQEEVAKLDEVVVTGYFERKSESFTGSASTYKSKDLKMVGKQNVLQSLRTLDPSFNIMENREFGSDPNRLPDMEIRGKTSVVGLKQQYGTDPNQPLFILDGFETTLQTVVDLNMERVASITLLKDAASTAIYGSKAANGVVVIETKRPAPGELRVTYTGDFEVTVPDLTDYNLMNAVEKLEFERLAGVYVDKNSPENQFALTQVYNERKSRIASGVDSYWLSEPVRTGFSHKHNLYLEGGDEAMRYGVGLSYNNTQGVMEGSGKEVFAGNLDLLYRKGKFSFSNKLTLDYYNTSNSPVSFDRYAETSPYYTKTDDNGEVSLYLERTSQTNTARKDVFNPVFDARLTNKNGDSYLGARNNFQAEWNPFSHFRVKARFGVNKSLLRTEKLMSSEHSSFAGTADQSKKGSYSKNSLNSWSYDGDLTLTYGNLFKEVHQVNFVGGWTFTNVSTESDQYLATGFAGDDVTKPSFVSRYPENGKPVFSQGQSRTTGFFANLGYAYDDRYMIDANVRIDGSSVFGSNKMYTTTWSAGLSWNIHNEIFLKENGLFNLLKLRASIGNPGNQNFSGTNSFTTYVYNTSLSNWWGAGAVVDEFGNPDLDWQKTLDLNIGLDVAILQNRFRFTADVYRKKTDPLLVVATVASSTGSTSFNTNLGNQLTRGMSASVYYSPIYRLDENINWTVTVNVRKQKSEYGGIGSNLDAMNQENQGSSLIRYYDGGSPTAIWAVRSAGIDPMTGKEVYIKKNGAYTFEHDYQDEVVVGDTEPKFEGVIGTTFYWKGFSLSAYFRYRFGADVFNSALYDKVENITKSNWMQNLDARALYDRWQKPGDIARFKGIGIVDEADPMSGRFVQKENSLAGESFSVGYEFIDKSWMKSLCLRSLTVKAYMNDIFRVSTIKAERGIQYPFARSVSFSVSATF